MRMIRELQRHRVVRVALVYLGSAFVVLQAADLLFPVLPVPDWGFRALTFSAMLGFPLVLIAATVLVPRPTIVSPPAPQQQMQSVAVLPFVNISADADNEYFSDGITEELLNVLTKLGRFRVPARTSSFAYKGKDLDVREIGRQLGVDAVLQGSVRKAGDRVRVTSQLVNVADGFHIWSESYDRELRDIFELQDDIAFRIIEALNVHLTEQERRAIRKAPTQNVRAYEYYLRGRQLFYETRRVSLEQAREFFRRAIELDPTYALAHAGIADASSFLYMYYEHTDANLSAADRASRSALEHDPELAEGHAARGMALSLKKEYAAAERELARAIELDPTLFEAYYFFARACWAQGKLEQAAQYFLEANRVRPEDFQSLILLSNVYDGLGHRENQVAAARRALDIIMRHLQLYPHDVRARYMGAGALVVVGERERGREWLEETLASTDDPGAFYNVACSFVHLGEYERALDCLDRAVAAGFAHREWMENDPDLAPLKGNPRFTALLASLSAISVQQPLEDLRPSAQS